jgi:hypothetical protein
LTAAPVNLAAEVTVIKWQPDFTYDTLRQGTDRLVCYDLSGLPGQPMYSVQCTSFGNLPRVAQTLKGSASADQKQARPEYGSVWYDLAGPTRYGATSDLTIAVPGANSQSLGLPDKDGSNGTWIMNAGTTSARLVIPGTASSLAATAPAAATPLALAPGASPAEINRILLAAPVSLVAEATVIQWKPDFSYDTLRKGRNDLVCYDLADRPSHQPFAAECTSLANLDRVSQTLKIEAMGDRAPSMLAEAEENGTRIKPKFGSVWYDLTGPHRWDAKQHITVAVPGATMRTLRLPENGNSSGVWIMNPGTTSARLVLPNDPPDAMSPRD